MIDSIMRRDDVEARDEMKSHVKEFEWNLSGTLKMDMSHPNGHYQRANEARNVCLLAFLSAN